MSTPHTQIGSIVALLSLSLLPSLSHADRTGRNAAMDACIQAFVATNFEKGRPVSVKKEEIAVGPLDWHARSYRIGLQAIGADSRQRIARAICVADRNGAVLSMSQLPVRPLLLAEAPGQLGR
jgi:hypothetical protein